MLKAVGALMLLCGCAGVGFSAVKQLDRRVDTLRSVIAAMELLEKELSFHMLPMRDLLLATSNGTTRPASDFLGECVNALDLYEDRLFSEIWSLSAEKTLVNLNSTDRDALDSLGKILGRFDVDGQRNAIRLTNEQLKQNLTNAVEERGSKGKVYRTVSVAAGTFIVILLL